MEKILSAGCPIITAKNLKIEVETGTPERRETEPPSSWNHPGLDAAKSLPDRNLPLTSMLTGICL
jgi:hypothetical protein